MKTIALLLTLVLACVGQEIQAQQFAEYPSYYIQNKPIKTSVAFYVPIREQVMVLHKGQYQWYDLKGEPLADPVTITKRDGDLLFPAVSASGKKIMYYTPAPDLLKKQGLTVFDTDSGYAMGTYELHYFDELSRTRFLGDSMLNVYSTDDKTKNLAIWNFRTRQVNSQILFEDKDGFLGTPEVSFWNQSLIMAYRKRDTLALINYRTDKKEQQFLEILPLPSSKSKRNIQITDGFPYLMVTNTENQETHFYSAPDSNFITHSILKNSSEIVAASGSPAHCYVLFADTIQKSATLQLFDAVTNVFITTTIPTSVAKTHFTQLFLEQDLVVTSNRLNGSMEAYRLSTGTLVWDFSIKQDGFLVKDTAVNALPTNFFKVMMKQGTNDVSNVTFDQKNNQLLLIKNSDQLITVDASSESLVRRESYNQDGSRIINATLLPGNRFIKIVEEYWKKDLTSTFENYDGKLERNEDLNAKHHIFPYGCKIYDRVKQQVVWDIKLKSLVRFKNVNDSLIAWCRNEDLSEYDSISILNLHTGKLIVVRPTTNADISDVEIALNNNELLILSKLSNNQILLTNQRNKTLFSRQLKNLNSYENDVAFSSNPSFFYFKTELTKDVNEVYRIVKDSVQLVGKLPANIEVKAEASVKDQLYFLYSKEEKISKDDVLFQYRFLHVNKGMDKLVQKVTAEENNSYKYFQLYPSEGYFTENSSGSVTWKALNNGYEIKEFGRYEHSISSITYSADGRYLAAGSPSGEVMLWDLGTGKETKSLRVANGGYISKLAFSGDGKYIAAASGDIWETATGKNVVSVTDGSIWNVHSIDFSNDGQRIISAGACIISWDAADGSKLVFQQIPNSSDMDTINKGWNPNGYVDPAFKFMAFSTAFHPNSRDFVVGNKNGIVQKWNTENDSLYAANILPLVANQSDKKVYDIKYSRDGKYVIAVQEKMIYKLNGYSLKIEDSLLLNDNEKILGIDIDHEGAFIGCITKLEKDYVAQLRSFNTLKVVHSFTTEGGSFNKISFSPNKKHLATASDDGFCTIWDYKTLAPVMYLNSMGSYQNVMVTPDNYYMASKAALEGVNFYKDGQFYSFDQFDLYLNRPDIVLNRLGYANPELVHFYRNAYLKRLKKVTGNTTDTIMKAYVPELLVTNKANLPTVMSTGNLGVSIEVKDSNSIKGKLKIFINGNLVQTAVFKTSDNPTLQYNDSLKLSQGRNNIEIVYSDHAAVESRKEKLMITYAPEKPLPSRVWYFGVGVSDYKNKSMNLRYPVKDIRDMAAAFKKKYPNIIIDTLMNEQATRANILALRNRLLQTSIEDKVIISFSGHGLLSDSLNWYFANADIDFEHPETSGLAYDQMEGLLDGIPARKKLLLLDACHSGEVDKEEDITFINVATAMDSSVVTNDVNTRGTILIGKSKAGLQTSFEMMQELFANLNYGNGTTVLSAAGGREYALESDKWKNGVFTFSLLKSLQNETTDADGNRSISIRELKEAVFEKVRSLTGGRQKPTSRVEIMDDWIIWE